MTLKLFITTYLISALLLPILMTIRVKTMSEEKKEKMEESVQNFNSLFNMNRKDIYFLLALLPILNTVMCFMLLVRFIGGLVGAKDE